jgi:formate hydrogenlyase subunit 3/multisubunit Na+/H+ antiporter MnhD subunit
VVAVSLVLLLVVFVAIARPVAGMLFGPYDAADHRDMGERDARSGVTTVANRPAASVVPLAMGLVVLVIIGVAAPLDGLLQSAAAIVGTR